MLPFPWSFPLECHLCVSVFASLWLTEGWGPVLIFASPRPRHIPCTCGALYCVMNEGKSSLRPDYVSIRFFQLSDVRVGGLGDRNEELGECWRETGAIWGIIFQSDFFFALIKLKQSDVEISVYGTWHIIICVNNGNNTHYFLHISIISPERDIRNNPCLSLKRTNGRAGDKRGTRVGVRVLKGHHFIPFKYWNVKIGSLFTHMTLKRKRKGKCLERYIYIKKQTTFIAVTTGRKDWEARQCLEIFCVCMLR